MDRVGIYLGQMDINATYDYYLDFPQNSIVIISIVMYYLYIDYTYLQTIANTCITKYVSQHIYIAWPAVSF